MNRTSVIDLESPLERGGPLAVGSVDEMTRLRGALSRKGSKQPGLTRSVLSPRHLLTLRSLKRVSHLST